jgi:glutathione S-transferase
VLDDRLIGHRWLAGDAFSAADVMTVTSLTTMRSIFPYSLREHPHILAYLQRVGRREAWRRAVEKGDPGFSPPLEAEVSS